MNIACIPRPTYDRPFHWWGYARSPAVPPQLSALVSRQFLTADSADYLVDVLNSGKSIAVVSNASGAGKSTLLWALVDQVRGDLPRIYIRGQYEPFFFGRPAETRSPPVLLMINEVSPHLPVYCWGKVRDRLFGPEFARFQRAATAHACSLDAFRASWDSWSGSDSHCSTRPFDIAVFIAADDRDRSQFRVSDMRTFD